MGRHAHKKVVIVTGASRGFGREIALRFGRAGGRVVVNFLTREQDAAKASEIDEWVDQLSLAWNVLPLDGRTFRTWAKLMHRRSDELLVDALIAATAINHQLIVATRNTGDFAQLGVETLDPFKAGRARK